MLNNLHQVRATLDLKVRWQRHPMRVSGPWGGRRPDGRSASVKGNHPSGRRQLELRDVTTHMERETLRSGCRLDVN